MAKKPEQPDLPSWWSLFDQSISKIREDISKISADVSLGQVKTETKINELDKELNNVSEALIKTNDKLDSVGKIANQVRVDVTQANKDIYGTDESIKKVGTELNQLTTGVNILQGRFEERLNGRNILLAIVAIIVATVAIPTAFVIFLHQKVDTLQSDVSQIKSDIIIIRGSFGTGNATPVATLTPIQVVAPTLEPIASQSDQPTLLPATSVPTALSSILPPTLGFPTASPLANPNSTGNLTFVIVSHGGVGNPFWSVAIRGMEDACGFLEADCQWLSEPDNGIEQMADYWNAALEMSPDGIGTTIPDPEVIRNGVERAAELDIPVIAFNTADPGAGTDEALPTLFYIGANEFLGGRSNAQAVLDAAEADGTPITTAVCPIQEPGNSNLEARCAGVRSVLEEQGITVNGLNVSNSPEETASALEEYFAANPDSNAIFMLGPQPVSGLNLYIQSVGLEPRQLYATGHDTSEEIYQMILDGYLLQTVDQQPYAQGFETIMWLYLNSQYKLVPGGDVLTGPGVINLNNVEDIIRLTEMGYR